MNQKFSCALSIDISPKVHQSVRGTPNGNSIALKYAEQKVSMIDDIYLEILLNE